MASLYVRFGEMKTHLSWKQLFCSAVVAGFLALPVAAVAQAAEQEASEPLTAEDITEGVAAVKALKSDAAKVQSYCSMLDMVDDAQPAEGAAADPKAEAALDAKVDKVLATLGEDFADAYYALEELPENDPMGQPLVAAFADLDKACGDDDEAAAP